MIDCSLITRNVCQSQCRRHKLYFAVILMVNFTAHFCQQRKLPQQGYLVEQTFASGRNPLRFTINSEENNLVIKLVHPMPSKSKMDMGSKLETTAITPTVGDGSGRLSCKFSINICIIIIIRIQNDTYLEVKSSLLV